MISSSTSSIMRFFSAYKIISWMTLFSSSNSEVCTLIPFLTFSTGSFSATYLTGANVMGFLSRGTTSAGGGAPPPPPPMPWKPCVFLAASLAFYLAHSSIWSSVMNIYESGSSDSLSISGVNSVSYLPRRWLILEIFSLYLLILSISSNLRPFKVISW